MTEFRPGTSPPPVRIPIRRGRCTASMLSPVSVPAPATGGDPAAGMIAAMNYELFMGEALAEARAALAQGERPHAAVAVVDDAMVARGHDRVRETGDPTAHAVIVALREAARRLG